MNTIETFWDKLLSREKNAIIEAYNSLSQKEQVKIVNHLEYIISSPDYLDQQKESASVAMQTIKEIQIK